MAESWCSFSGECLILALYIQPKASKNKVCGVFNQHLKVQITAPPDDGRANRHLIKWLAKRYNIAKSNLAILSGETSRYKRLEIRDVLPQRVIASLVATL